MIPLLYQLSYTATGPRSLAILERRIHRASPGFRNRLRRVLLPPRCLGCGALRAADPVGEGPREVPRPGASPPIPLCRTCRGSVPPDAPPLGSAMPCLGCLGRAAPGSAGRGGSCPFCRATPPARPLVHLGPHRGPLRDLVVSAKWSGNAPATALLADWLARACWYGYGSPVPADAVVAVPRSPLRRLRHGRALSETLAAELALRLGLRLLPPPPRRGGRPQTALGVGERRSAPRRSFAPTARNPRRYRGLALLLVDDVVTTGATLTACAAALERAGARSVFTAVASATPPTPATGTARGLGA